MTEANLLSLVTLRSEYVQLPSITLQPLICADVFSNRSERFDGSGIEAMASHAGCFTPTPPEHIDVVSLCTCTPTRERALPPSVLDNRYEWYQEFRDPLVGATQQSRFFRHRYAMFVLSNYYLFPEKDNTKMRRPGGLSGAFVPRPFKETGFPRFTSVWVYGQSAHPFREAISWMPKDEFGEGKDNATSQAYIISLGRNRTTLEARARILKFDIERLPRWACGSAQGGNIVNLDLFNIIPDKFSEGSLYQVSRETNHAS